MGQTFALWYVRYTLKRGGRPHLVGPFTGKDEALLAKEQLRYRRWGHDLKVVWGYGPQKPCRVRASVYAAEGGVR